MEWSGNGEKQAKIMQKIFQNLFGSVRMEFEPNFPQILESSGTLRLTEFYTSPGTGQKPALTPYLTTIRKLYNRV